MDFITEKRALLVAVSQHHRHARIRRDERLETCLRISSFNKRMGLERLCTRRCRSVTKHIEHFGQVSHEAHARERLRYLCRIKIRKRKIFKIDLDRHIAHNRSDFARKEGIFFMVRKILKLLSLESIEMRIDALEIVEFLQHGRSLLVSDTGNARDIICLIALQA